MARPFGSDGDLILDNIVVVDMGLIRLWIEVEADVHGPCNLSDLAPHHKGLSRVAGGWPGLESFARYGRRDAAVPPIARRMSQSRQRSGRWLKAMPSRASQPTT